MNSSASNGPFHSTVDPSTGEVLEGKRRKIAANSLLKMNAYFQALAETSWEETAISTRAENLFIQALKVWNRPVAPA
ncbi:DUF1524 domain-containing protein [Methylomonas koyamae]|uniref:DUF1524 domain-containing protein n=1 Tax=Methylomonas koyamae TaxID=702114 RepID=UPI0012FDF7D7|nr:DUF1524 domain-containing protein [Methylomonas koyamae]